MNKPTSDTELMPCPFCGQQDFLVEQLDSDASVVICCGRIDEHCACLARGPIGLQEDDFEAQPGRAAAVREWNRRALAVKVPGRATGFSLKAVGYNLALDEVAKLNTPQ